MQLSVEFENNILVTALTTNSVQYTRLNLNIFITKNLILSYQECVHGAGSRLDLLAGAPELLREAGQGTDQRQGPLHVPPQPGRCLPHGQEVSLRAIKPTTSVY